MRSIIYVPKGDILVRILTYYRHFANVVYFLELLVSWNLLMYVTIQNMRSGQWALWLI